MGERKIIHAQIYDPSGPSLFKRKKTDRAECKTVSCSNSENCSLFKQGQCAWLGVNWQRCPYGVHNTEVGFTQKARAYYSWVAERSKKYSEVLNQLTSHKGILAEIGDYFFLPYKDINEAPNVEFTSKGGYFSRDNGFILKENLTIEAMIAICEYRPRYDPDKYQKESVGKFIQHLYEIMPDKYWELVNSYPRAVGIMAERTNVGRKAKLISLTPNVGFFVDIHKAKWVWDGEYLTSHNSRASFMLISDFEELRLKPKEGAVVTITDNAQVNKNTDFVS